ncbi:MAG: D-alanyl-D-alanine carboxypeptidase family protein [Calditrichaeota bacterium]|nr:MAG: D-alanyl-D-alanine carboxypeptidase family protein [Calditrichota bacterium]
MRKQILAFLFVVVIASVSYAECDETITIDSVDYKISDVWCGKKIDTTQIPEYEDLSRIPDDFCSKDYKIYIRKAAAESFVEMAEAALADSIVILAKSGFRSSSYQKQMIRKRLKEGMTFEEIITFVAPPGYSDHSLGLALDLSTTTYPFGESKAYKWLLENAVKYNYYEQYPKGNDELKTWEPWHWKFDSTLTK